MNQQDATDAGLTDTAEVEAAADTTADASADIAEEIDAGPQPWASALFPPDWTPTQTTATGDFLHDVSYAGYHLGGVDPADPVTATVFEVTDFGAEATTTVDDTLAFQKTIDAVQKNGGGIVHVKPGTYRLDGVLKITKSNVILRGDGPQKSKLYFSKFAGLAYSAHIQVGALPKDGVDLPLAVTGHNREFQVTLQDASALKIGDTVALGWVITPEFIADHGMTGTWQAFNGKWQPFFRRTVLAVDGNTVTLDVPLRYDALPRDQASLRIQTGWLKEVAVEHLGLSNAVAYTDAWKSTQTHILQFQGVQDGWVRDVQTFESPLAQQDGIQPHAHVQSGALLVEACMRVTVADCVFQKAQNRGDGGNGYLYEFRTSSEVLVRDCEGMNGRHNFIQNWGFGMTGWVLLRCHSSGGLAQVLPDFDIGTVGHSEFHHSLAMANLIDDCIFDDGFYAINRGAESTGAGHTATQTVIWRPSGTGEIKSMQYGRGYVIGSAEGLKVTTDMNDPGAFHTEPQDWTEGLGQRETLSPPSLYEAMHQKRLGW